MTQDKKKYGTFLVMISDFQHFSKLYPSEKKLVLLCLKDSNFRQKFMPGESAKRAKLTIPN